MAPGGGTSLLAAATGALAGTLRDAKAATELAGRTLATVVDREHPDLGSPDQTDDEHEVPHSSFLLPRGAHTSHRESTITG